MRQRKDDGGRGDLTDEQWLKLKPLLPPQKAHTGQPAHDHRRIVTAYFGCTVQVPHGAISQKDTANTVLSPVGSTDGELQEFGSRFGQA